MCPITVPKNVVLIIIQFRAGAESLGSNNQCVTYVFFVVRAHAVGSGRVAALVITSILTTGYTVVTCHELYAWYKSRKSQRERHSLKQEQGEGRGEQRRPSINSDGSRRPEETAGLPTVSTVNHSGQVPPVIPPVTASSLTVPGSNLEPSDLHPDSAARQRRRDTGTRGQKTNRPRKKQWSGGWDPMLLGIAAFQIIVFTYFVLSSELLLHWNNDNGNNGSWGFGQASNVPHPILLKF